MFLLQNKIATFVVKELNKKVELENRTNHKTKTKMKNSWQILTLLLATALVVLTTKDLMNSTKAEANVDPREAVINNIMTRSSVRAYTDQKVSNADIETLLKAGMAAPSSRNKQPWELVVITDREVLDQLPGAIRGASMAANAPLAIAVCGVPARRSSSDPKAAEIWVQDCSAVSENILLAAHAMGLGAVWCGAYPENTANTTKVLQLPNGVIPMSVIVIGHPSGEPNIKDKWDPAKVHYNRY